MENSDIFNYWYIMNECVAVELDFCLLKKFVPYDSIKKNNGNS